MTLPNFSYRNRANATSNIAGEPSIMLSSQQGPFGSMIRVTGDGFDSNSQYSFCMDPSGATKCADGAELAIVGNGGNPYLSNTEYPGEFSATGAMLSSGIMVDLQWGNPQTGSQSIDLFPAGSSGPPMASAPFRVTPPDAPIKVTANSDGNSIAFSGGGFLPSTVYLYCKFSSTGAACPAGSPSFTTDANGNLTSGSPLLVPSSTPSGSYEVGFEQNGTGAVVVFDPFTVKGSSVVPGPFPSNSSTSPMLYEIVGVVVVAAVAAGVLFMRRKRMTGRIAGPVAQHG
jgi:hypothetical protein